MMRLVGEQGQTLVGYALILVPASIVVAFALAVAALTNR
jgi:hypothetical protein